MECPQSPKVKTEKDADGEKLGRSQLEKQLSRGKPGDFLPIGYIKVLEKFGTPILDFYKCGWAKESKCINLKQLIVTPQVKPFLPLSYSEGHPGDNFWRRSEGHT